MSNHLTHMKKVRLIIRLYTEGVSKKTIIERKLDYTDLSKDDDIKTLPLHNNIRGKRYYK